MIDNNEIYPLCNSWVDLNRLPGDEWVHSEEYKNTMIRVGISTPTLTGGQMKEYEIDNDLIYTNPEYDPSYNTISGADILHQGEDLNPMLYYK